MIPLYGFLQGDTLGLVLLADPGESVESLARRLERSASVRVAPRARLVVMLGDRALDGRSTIAEAGLRPLDRFDVVEAP